MAKYLIHMMNNLNNQKKIVTLLSINYNKSKKQFFYEKDRLYQVREDRVKRKCICECIKNRADKRGLSKNSNT